ncbi:MAG TPA: DUF924 family protein [Rubrivivax sp.]|nr:DUF924 domain-containing protein [Pseudomonadota bacterium]HOL36438.1 DUF924 family protein [Rubrivivax sp.]HPP83299.1 DUF924 family protein [Rubrivivax sp.]
MDEAQAILDFWFGAADAPRDEWFRKDAAFDERIRARFGALVERALAGELVAWERAPHTALARILLLDQFTRNIHRGSARAFAGDALALAAARALVASGADRRLAPLQRWFVYLPFEHAEDAAAQAESLRLFGALAAEAPSLASALEWADRHAAVIARFGRYPHRNEALGRASTPEEIEFLKQPGSSF